MEDFTVTSVVCCKQLKASIRLAISPNNSCCVVVSFDLSVGCVTDLSFWLPFSCTLTMIVCFHRVWDLVSRESSFRHICQLKAGELFSNIYSRDSNVSEVVFLPSDNAIFAYPAKGNTVRQVLI